MSQSAGISAAAPVSPASAVQPPMSATQRGLITFITSMASMIFALDSTIANVALPYIQGTMAASREEIDWVLTSYIAATAIMTAPVGYLAAHFGRTRLFVAAIVGFSIASVFCGMSRSMGEIVVARTIQGMAGAALVPLSQAILFDIYPLERRGFAMSMWSTGVNLGPILGPTLGGWITSNYSWPWVFYINVPLGAITAIGVILTFPETRINRSARLDWTGFLSLGLAIAAFQTLLDRGETKDWFSSTEIIAEALLAGAGFYLFLVQSALSPRPLFSPGLFKDTNFLIGLVIYFTIGLLIYAIMALLAPYLQDLMNYPVETAGIAMAPRGAGTMGGALIAGRMVRYVSPRLLIAFGLGCTAWALYLMVQWSPDISQWQILSTSIIQGVGLSFISIPLSVVAFATLQPALRTEATAVYNLARNLGSSIGISVTGALLVQNTQINHAIIAGAVTPFSRPLQSGAPSHFWNPAQPFGAANLNLEVTRQANIIAYLDDFKLLLLLVILVLPLTLLIRSAPRLR
jgi:DHA2 family multidrug resistance protein